MDTSRGTVSGPVASPSARLWAARLRLSAALSRFVRGVDASDVLTVVSLVCIFVGLAQPSAAFGVVGFLLVLLTPIGAALRVLIRGK